MLEFILDHYLTKEVIGAIASICTAVYFIVWWTTRSLRNQVDESLKQHDVAVAQRELARNERDEAKDELGTVGRKLADVVTERDKARAEAEKDKTRAEKEESRANQEEERANELRLRIENAVGRDGQSWTVHVPADCPKMKPLDQRLMPILSVLNLKGGVGKTTIAANLAAALDDMGFRILLIDLDLQGSLSHLLLTPQQEELAFKHKKSIGEFLFGSFDSESPNLLDYTVPVFGGKSRIVPLHDSIVYAETNITIRWHLREVKKDPRFLLRRELNFERIRHKFDMVILDCPPMINAACVNALATSDYVLIPVMPSAATTVRAVSLLRHLQEFSNVNPALHVMGILSNRTQKADLTADEKNRLTALHKEVLNHWGAKVHFFETSIPQSVQIRQAEEANRALGSEDSMFKVFLALAQEVRSLLPNFCLVDHKRVVASNGEVVA